MATPDFVIEPIESMPFAEMSYVVWRPGQRHALVVDPGFEPQLILDYLRSQDLDVEAILNTHGHVDHIAGNAAMKQAFPGAPLIIGRNEAHLLSDPRANMSFLSGVSITSPPADQLVGDGDRLEFPATSLTFDVREIPGHSPGSVVYICKQFQPPFVLGGDVLFSGSVGRTDLGGNAGQLFRGIRDHLFTLPEDTVVWPGHGPPTTIGFEQEKNPFVGTNPDPIMPG
jgi:glyoxylase-like metal-dependent hydrolase (beta-lactamase superfamily II)